MFTQGRVRVIALWIADIACICTMWVVAVCGYWLLGRGLTAAGIETSIGGYSPIDYLEFWPVAVLFLVFNMLFDLYHGNWMYPAAPLSPVEEMRRLFGSAMLTHLAVLVYLVLAYQTTRGSSRVVIVVSGLLTAVLAQSFRNLMRRFLLRVGIGQIPVLMAGGGGDVPELIASVLSNDPYVGFRIVGYFAGTDRLGRKKRRKQWHDKALADRGIRYLGTLRDIVPEAQKRDIKILMACQDERLFRQQMEEFTKWFTYIEYLPTAKMFPILGARAVSFDGVGGLEMINQGRMKMKRLQKRILDTFLALLVFLFFLPAFVVLPILIKLTSRGPVFYRHNRIGMGGKPIRIWKFRSMFRDADERLQKLLASNSRAAKEWKENFKLAKDPRVTLLGRLLRKTSLDELPQIFNVFSGEMALIGPRPIVEDEIRYYGDSYRVFSSVRPGITGLWQVSGRSDTDYARRVGLDTYYALNWSPWLDFWILRRTFAAVFSMRGAC